MIKCSHEAFAKCQIRCNHCRTEEEAFFLDGSDCHKFNQEVLAAPKTNADRIRAMSNEELAQLLYNIDARFCNNDPACAAMLDAPDGIPEEKCLGCLMKWLQQPVEGGQ